MNLSRARQLLDAFRSKRILVAGDLILDEFVWGKVRRISPEAPVPVVEVDRESYYPGGAANVARNLRAFTGDVRVLGVVGDGPHADHLRRLLATEGISLDSLRHDPAYQTIVKTRIIARHQQVVRVDREKKANPSPELLAAALDHIEKILPQLDAVILEDYGKGLLGQQFADRICELGLGAGKIVTVDPNPGNPLEWRNVTALKPNRAEAFAAAGRPPADPVEPATEDRDLLEVGRILLEKWQPENLLITLGEQGMMLFRANAAPFHIPTRAREVFDVSGAGDTAIALLTLALAAGADPVEAAEIANHGSGIVVAKLGTATVTPEELLASFDENVNA